MTNLNEVMREAFFDNSPRMRVLAAVRSLRNMKVSAYRARITLAAFGEITPDTLNLCTQTLQVLRKEGKLTYKNNTHWEERKQV